MLHFCLPRPGFLGPFFVALGLAAGLGPGGALGAQTSPGAGNAVTRWLDFVETGPGALGAYSLEWTEAPEPDGGGRLQSRREGLRNALIWGRDGQASFYSRETPEQSWQVHRSGRTLSLVGRRAGGSGPGGANPGGANPGGANLGGLNTPGLPLSGSRVLDDTPWYGPLERAAAVQALKPDQTLRFWFFDGPDLGAARIMVLEPAGRELWRPSRPAQAEPPVPPGGLWLRRLRFQPEGLLALVYSATVLADEQGRIRVFEGSRGPGQPVTRLEFLGFRP